MELYQDGGMDPIRGFLVLAWAQGSALPGAEEFARLPTTGWRLKP